MKIETHRSCQAFLKGRVVNQADFEDLRTNWRKMGFLNDPSIHSFHPFDDRLDQKPLCHCYSNLRQCSALEVTVNPNAVD